MIIDLDRKQKILLLETLGRAHAVQWMQKKDTKPLEELIQKMSNALKNEGNEDIFNSVFQEYKA